MRCVFAGSSPLRLANGLSSLPGQQHARDPAIHIVRSLARSGLRSRNGTIDFTSEEWNSISPSALSLVQRMVEKDPTKRITLREVLENEWVVSPPRRRLQLPQRSVQSMQALQMSLPSTLPGSHFYGMDGKEA